VVSLFAGYVSLLVTNFFGFSVVPTQLELFLFPAIVLTMHIEEEKTKNKKVSVNSSQKIGVGIVLILAFYLIFIICRYWYTDTLYATGYAYNHASRPDLATNYLVNAINLEPYQPLYYSELANSYAELSLAFNQQKDATDTQKFADLAVSESDRSISLAPNNFIFKMSRFGVFVMLSTVNPNYLLNAQATLVNAINEAPTYAKLYYNLGLTYDRTNQVDLAVQTLQKAVELKSDYTDARLALAIILVSQKNYTNAKVQLNYILTNLDPGNSIAKQTLAGIK
jgi:tetratricopeptide (TPR) repeat protein